MAKEHMDSGMMVLIFGILLAVAGLGLFAASWFNGWTILGVFMILWGLMPMMKG